MSYSNNLPIEWIERIFMRLHGRFGNAFLDKFRIGSLNDKGEDIGLENAKKVWSEELANVSVERIKAGLLSSFDYPPSCDDFKAKCRVTRHPDISIKLPRKYTEEELEINRKRAEELVNSFKLNKVKP